MSHKDTKGKLKLNLVPPRGIEEIARVREFGSIKYSDPWGWKKAVDPEDFIDAARRHLLAHQKGEKLDPESGLKHLSHAATSLLMALEIINTGEE